MLLRRNKELSKCGNVYLLYVKASIWKLSRRLFYLPNLLLLNIIQLRYFKFF
jgi:hypothetical protein